MDEEKERTAYVGNLSDEVSEEILYELFLQAGPIVRITRPKDRESGRLKNFAFVLFSQSVSVPYAIHLTNGIRIFNRAIKTQKRDGYELPHYSKVGIHNIECEMDLEKSLNGSQDEEEDSGYHTYSSERKRHDRSFKPQPLDPNQTWKNNIIHHEEQQRNAMVPGLGLSPSSMSPSPSTHRRNNNNSSYCGGFGSSTPRSASHYHNMNSQILNNMSDGGGSFDLRSTLSRSASTSQISNPPSYRSMNQSFDNYRDYNNSRGSYNNSYNNSYSSNNSFNDNSYNRNNSYNGSKRGDLEKSKDRHRSYSNDRNNRYSRNDQYRGNNYY